MAPRHVRRLDLGELQPATKREDGTIRAQAHLTRCGIFSYIQPDGSVQKELREQEQVFDPASLNSFNGVPVTLEHPPEMVNAKNAKKYMVGSVQGNVFRDDDHIRGNLAIYDADSIQAINQGKRQISLGYVCDLDETSGHHPVYGDYDVRQINIRGNHCAIVDSARAGSTARIRLDAAERIDGGPGSGPHPGGTYAEARQHHLANLKEAGWSVKTKNPQGGPMKVPHATSPSGEHRMWFKPQAVHITVGNQHELGNARTLDYTHDIRKMSTPELISKVTGTKRIDSFEGLWMGRLDEAGTPFASRKIRAITVDMADEAKAEGGSPKKGDPDPKDEASRNAAGDDDSKPVDKAKANGEGGAEEEKDVKVKVKDGGDEPDTEEPDGDDDDENPDDDEDSDEEDPDDVVEKDAADECLPADGKKLKPEHRRKIATSTFAVPDREGLPIHDEKHVRDSMKNFDDYKFENPDEQHAAHNRIVKRAKQFGVASDGFQKAQADKLDHKDQAMIENEKLTKLRARLDSVEKELATAQGQVASLTKDLEASKAQITKARTDAEDALTKRVEDKVALLAKASATGAKVDATMTDRAIKVAVIKHVDKVDVEDSKHIEYVNALCDGAIARAKTDAKATADGANALAAARVVVAGPPAAPIVKVDADDTDEAKVAAKMRKISAEAYEQPFTRKHKEHN